jgi:hypothetical protein
MDRGIEDATWISNVGLSNAERLELVYLSHVLLLYKRTLRLSYQHESYPHYYRCSLRTLFLLFILTLCNFLLDI